MREDLITVVTGEPRSGTSMQMQSLHLLGVPVAGKEFPLKEVREKNEFDIAVAEKNKRMNPKGFYEVPGVVIRGTRDIEPYKGKAVKIITSGIWPRTARNGMEFGTPPSLVDKYIFCVRNPRQIAISQKDLSDRGVLGPSEDGEGWALPQRSVSASVFIERSGPALVWMSRQPQDVLDKFMSVDFGDMITDPASVLPGVMDHIERTYTSAQMQAAVANVEKALNRSISLKDWPDDMENEGMIADRLYGAFKSLNRVEMAATSTAVQEFILSKRFESAVWVDDEDTWVTMTVETKRQVAINKYDLATTLRTQLPDYRRNFMICDQCDHYERDAGKVYTIRRPDDLGALTRPMVKCGRDDEYKTVEMCKSCWQQGSTVNGNLMPSQRSTQLG